MTQIIQIRVKQICLEPHGAFSHIPWTTICVCRWLNGALHRENGRIVVCADHSRLHHETGRRQKLSNCALGVSGVDERLLYINQRVLQPKKIISIHSLLLQPSNTSSNNPDSRWEPVSLSLQSPRRWQFLPSQQVSWRVLFDGDDEIFANIFLAVPAPAVAGK